MLENRIFEDTKTAFALKSDSELDRAYFLFKMISVQPLVRLGTAVTRFALNANLPVEKLIRATVFDHFCGGTNLQDCNNTIDAMYTKRVHSILDFSVEGEEDESLFDNAYETVADVVDFAKTKDSMPFAVFKPTGFGRFELWRKKSAREELSAEEKKEWERVRTRFDKICSKASEADICLLIDAEESWMQESCDVLVEEMMAKYNKDRAIVFNTIQCYRWDRLDYVKVLHKDAQEKGYIPGVKIVRGAYMEKERKRANEELYDSPICKDKFETDAHFNAVMSYCLDNLDDIWMFIG
ncbi:MAG: proline dehydrogenase family protein, partial [Leeuwenhoekiella sp.]